MDKKTTIGALLLAASGNTEWPSDRSIDGFDLRCTCASHPEQYDVYKGDEQVAYLRLRCGIFSVSVPDCGGEIVYDAEPAGDELFAGKEREHYLSEAVKAIKQHLA